MFEKQIVSLYKSSFCSDKQIKNNLSSSFERLLINPAALCFLF